MSSISSITSAINPYQITGQSAFAQSVKDFKSVGTALQSGDLSSAQSALAIFQQNQPASSQSANSQPFGKNSQANTDYQTLTTALKSGDLAGAQKAFTSIQSDLKAAHKGHHHHHAASTPATATTSSTDTTTSPDTTGGTGSSLNAVA